MTAQQRALLQAFWSKRWVWKSMCVVVAAPIVLGIFVPVMGLAQGMQG